MSDGRPSEGGPLRSVMQQSGVCIRTRHYSSKSRRVHTLFSWKVVVVRAFAGARGL